MINFQLNDYIYLFHSYLMHALHLYRAQQIHSIQNTSFCAFASVFIFFQVPSKSLRRVQIYSIIPVRKAQNVFEKLMQNPIIKIATNDFHISLR